MTVITAMLNWFDEDLDDLQRVVRDVARLGATQLVAVDGAYANFPGGKPRSYEWQQAQLEQSCIDCGVALLSYRPRDVWLGDEVSKRQFMLELAKTVTPKGDWLLVYDADYELLSAPPAGEIREHLAQTPAVSASVAFTTATEPRTSASWHRARLFLRNDFDIRMKSNHYTYYFGDGTAKSLILDDGSTAAVTHADGIRVYHRHMLRDSHRHDAQAAYYEIRDGQGLES